MKRILTKNRMIGHSASIFLFSAIVTLIPFGDCFGGKELGPQMKDVKNRLPKAGSPGESSTAKIMPEEKSSKGGLKNSTAVPTPNQEKNLFDEDGMDRLKTALAQARGERNTSAPSSASLEKNGIQKERVPLTLEQAINIALEHNLGLQISAFARDSAQTRISQQQALFHPTVGAMYSVSSVVDAEADPSAVTGESVDRTQILTAFLNQPLPTGSGASLNVTGSFTRENPGAEGDPSTYHADIGMLFLQPILRGGRVFVATKPIADAEYDLRVQEAVLRSLALQVVLQTKTAYYAMLQAEKQITVTEQSIERDKILKDTSVGLFEGGLTTLRDVYSAEIDLATDSATLAGNQATLQLAHNSLLDVLGIPIATTEIVLQDKDVSFQPIPLELSTWLEIALENRPEILSIKQQIAKNDLRIRAAKNTVLPQLDAFGGYRRFSPASVSSGNAFRFELEDWNAGLTFSVPLGNVRNNSLLAEAKIDGMRLQREMYQQQRQIQIEVLTAVIALRQSVAEMTALQAKIEQSQGKLETARARFALGVANNLDISDAQKDLRDAQTDMLDAIIQYNIGLATLEARIASSIQIARK